MSKETRQIYPEPRMIAGVLGVVVRDGSHASCDVLDMTIPEMRSFLQGRLTENDLEDHRFQVKIVVALFSHLSDAAAVIEKKIKAPAFFAIKLIDNEAEIIGFNLMKSKDDDWKRLNTAVEAFIACAKKIRLQCDLWDLKFKH